jgi:hypothetical protein
MSLIVVDFSQHRLNMNRVSGQVDTAQALCYLNLMSKAFSRFRVHGQLLNQSGPFVVSSFCCLVLIVKSRPKLRTIRQYLLRLLTGHTRANSMPRFCFDVSEKSQKNVVGPSSSFWTITMDNHKKAIA